MGIPRCSRSMAARFKVRCADELIGKRDFDFFASEHAEAAYADGLARHLTATGVKLYGAYWCPHCTDQKQMFGKAAVQLPYVECDARSPAGKPAVCAAAKIRAFPTWDIAGTRYEGVLSLEELARLSGFSPPP